ncbi:Hypothetical protein mma_3167 [Janthinobacterium sp. Marseille]|nr:hypothetical protein [Janthinobacterium sp. Marseille]ABR91492.1 Hypothetical protein mma_3167 [Janthinobacterium sp. Marseille]
MSKNQSTNSPDVTIVKTASALLSTPVDMSKPAIKKAIADGKALIAEGKAKADAARAMYPQISTESKETIIAAFVEGATLTPKGAQTYWYNCRRRASKEKKSAQ